MSKSVQQNKCYTQKLSIKCKNEFELLNISNAVQNALNKSKILEGFVNVNAMDTTCSCFINDDESGLHSDFKLFLDNNVKYYVDINGNKKEMKYKNNKSISHIKRQLFGRAVMVAVTKGKLDFGNWEQIFFACFDGKSNSGTKTVLIKILGI